MVCIDPIRRSSLEYLLIVKVLECAFTGQCRFMLGAGPVRQNPPFLQTSLTSALHSSSVSSFFPDWSSSLHPSSFFLLEPNCLLHGPPNPHCIRQSFMAKCQHHQCSWDDRRGESHWSQPTTPLCIYLSPSPGLSFNPPLLHKNIAPTRQFTFAHLVCLTCLPLQSPCPRPLLELG